ncbi:MAG: tetratricopeptide repeat protein [Treponema sp.]|jgi:tetratricopeptide (TPR) repeat protein|nr:tetratricopeptide repeat protein [Treponema sp.]
MKFIIPPCALPPFTVLPAPGLLCLLLVLALASPLQAQSAGTGGAASGNAPLTAVQNYRLGRDLEAGGRMDEANRYYNEAIRICQDEVARNTANQDTYTAITWALQRQQKYTQVISWGEQGLRLFANEYRIVETMGEAYFYLNDYDRSLDCMQRYTNAVPRGERSSVAYFFVAEIYRLRRQYFLADIAYTTALRLDPGVVLWWYRLATVQEALEDYAVAAESYRRALRLNPSYTEATAGLARVQARLE